MADKHTEIPFTVGDQERLRSIEDAVKAIPGALESMTQTIAQSFGDAKTQIEKLDAGLPCKQAPPQCTQQNRIEVLENAHKRGKWVSGSIIVAMVVYIMQVIFKHIIKGG